MIAYLDSSVLLRIVLRELNPLAEWDQLDDGITSTLTAVEAARTLDRERLLGTRSAEELREQRAEMADILARLDSVPIAPAVLARASSPLGLVLGTLDAIHLASAMICRAKRPVNEGPLLFATHDAQLARAARAADFEVIGA